MTGEPREDSELPEKFHRVGDCLQLTYHICRRKSCQTQEQSHSDVLMDSKVTESSSFLAQL